MKETSETYQIATDIQWEGAGEGIVRQMMGYDEHLMMVKVKFNQRNGIHTLSNGFHVCRCHSEGIEVFWFSYLSFTDDKEGLFNQP